ncbi:hypothetical protein GGX14DRAFT_401108 [Mycena pura]|uniref:Uncharacterized protein n=1 Tax=Mycena pura TaxID=153505 RepID=A0AAD6V1J7_9AGAR|nr:hypothetical protein GGX14DRAFT_401108 [Mycena pura]
MMDIGKTYIRHLGGGCNGEANWVTSWEDDAPTAYHHRGRLLAASQRGLGGSVSKKDSFQNCNELHFLVNIQNNVPDSWSGRDESRAVGRSRWAGLTGRSSSVVGPSRQTLFRLPDGTDVIGDGPSTEGRRRVDGLRLYVA